ncbi:MAG: hypothetical protein CME39_09705 [Haliea sp.]|nr:hypothetical protein [Haliea sp.]
MIEHYNIVTIPPHISAADLGVSARTLADWRNGRRQPGPGARILLALLADGRVMPDTAAWRGWCFIGQVLETVSGDTVTAAELDNVRLLRNLLDCAHRDNRRLLDKLRKAEDYTRQLEGAASAANAPRWRA